MRKNLIFSIWAALAVMGMASCNRQEEAIPLPKDVSDAETGLVHIQVNAPAAPGILTKVDGTAPQKDNERKVNSLQVFIFKKNGDVPASNPLEADKYVSDATSTILNSLTGAKSIWAVVNAPRLYGIRTEKQLMETVSTLSENRADNLVMTGQSSANVLQYNASDNGNVGNITPVSIGVERLCARISLHSVAANFSGTSLEDASLSLLEAYLINVPASCTLDGTPLSAGELGHDTAWYNFRQLGASADEQLLNDTHKLLRESGLSFSIDPTDATVGTTVDKYFYVYPNVSTAKSDEVSPSARMTRLILHMYIGATKDGRAARDSYYSFNIPVFGSGKTIERNHIYNISKITITNEGSPVPPPFPDMEYGKVNATVTVGEWGATETLTYEL